MVVKKKPFEISKVIFKLTASQTFSKMLIEDLAKEQILAIMVHGSISYDSEPNDIDVIVILRRGCHKFNMFFDGKLPVEVEAIPLENLLLPITKFRYYLLNWELEMAKFKYGEVIYDPYNIFYKIKRTALIYPKNIAKYLFLHRIGRCIYLLRKWEKAKFKESTSYRICFAEMALLAALAVRRIIPRRMNLASCQIKAYYHALEMMETANDARTILMQMTMDAIKKLGLEKDVLEKEFPFDIPLFFPAEVEGIRFILEILNSYNRLPTVVTCEEI